MKQEDRIDRWAYIDRAIESSGKAKTVVMDAPMAEGSQDKKPSLGALGEAAPGVTALFIETSKTSKTNKTSKTSRFVHHAYKSRSSGVALFPC